MYKRQVLELGGNDPIIVMEDADLDEAATLAAAGSYKNSGQRCTAVKRMLVHERVADALRRAAAREDDAHGRYGDPADRQGRHGHGDRRGRGAATSRRRCDAAVAQGATLLVGNERDGALYSPTVLDHVTPEMDVVRTETFGPGVAGDPLRRHRRGDPHLQRHRRTASPRRSARTASTTSRASSRELQVGTVNVREVPGYRLELTPFGGIKDSGLGYKEGVQEAMKSFTNVKTYSLPW